jgi:helicase
MNASADTMRTNELELPDRVIDTLEAQGYVTLHPPQADAIPKVLEGKNVVVAVPTASGKSLIGYVAALRTVLTERRKVLYIVPLKALAAEKRDDLEKFAHLGIKVVMSTGDLDSEDRWMSDADIVVATSEKADSLLRHRSQWMSDVGLVIADEIH